MKFIHAVHLLDADGAQVTTGVTRSGDVHLLITDGTGTARLSPGLADRLAEILRDCAQHARGGRYWAPLRGSEPCPRCGTPAGELHRKGCGHEMADDPGPVAPSPWGHPEPGPADDPDEPVNREIEPEPAGWYDVPEPEYRPHEPEPWT